MLQQARMPYVRFVTMVAETKDQDGHVIYKNKYFAHITPAGGKDELVKDAEEWVQELQRKGDTRGPFDAAANEYTRWYEHFSKGLDAFKKGEEMLTDGTPLRACMAFTKAEVAQAEAVRIYSVEELAQCNEEAIRNMGVGARALKGKAEEVLKSAKGNASAQEVTALRVKIEELTATIQAMKDGGAKEPDNKRNQK